MKKRTLCLVFALCIALGSLLAGCGSSAKYAADTAAPASPAGGENGFYYSEDMAAAEPQAMDAGSSSVSSGTPVSSVSPTPDEGLGDKIIYTAYLSVETTAFDDSLTALDSLLEQYGGFIESSETSGYASYLEDGSAVMTNRWGSYTVRIPADKYKAFLLSASETDALGNVVNKSEDSENITAQYTDFEIRLESLKTQYGTLLELLDKSTSIEDVIALEERISQVTYEIESIESTLRNYDRQVSYSTVTIALEEVRGYTSSVSVTSSFPERIKAAFSGMGENFKRSFQRFIVGFIYALPTLLILAVIIVIILIIIFACVRRRKARRAAGYVPKPRRRRERIRRKNKQADIPRENSEQTPEEK